MSIKKLLCLFGVTVCIPSAGLAKSTSKSSIDCRRDIMNIKHCRNGNELYGDNYHTRFQTNEYVISTQKNPLDHKSQNAYKIETSQNIYMEQGQVKTIEIKSLEANDAAQLRWNNGALVILDDTSENQNNSSADNKKNKKPTDSLTKTIKIFAAKTGYEEIIHISESNIPTDAIAVVVKPQVLNEHTINIYKGGTLSKVTFSKDEGNGTNKNTENSAK